MRDPRMKAILTEETCCDFSILLLDIPQYHPIKETTHLKKYRDPMPYGQKNQEQIIFPK